MSQQYAMRYCIMNDGKYLLNTYRTLAGAAAGLSWCDDRAVVMRWHPVTGASTLNAHEALRLARLTTVRDGQNTEGTL